MKNFKCKICGAQFANGNSLGGHVSSHKRTKRGPYKGSFLHKLLEIPREEIQEAVKNASSLKEALNLLGFDVIPGSGYPALKKLINEYGLISEIPTGRSWKKGKRKSKKEYLVNKKLKSRISGRILREALLEEGREYVCEECGQLPIWKGKDLILQVDHIDGNWMNNESHNLRFLCLHCHSQTDTYLFRNKSCCNPMEEDFDSKSKM